MKLKNMFGDNLQDGNLLNAYKNAEKIMVFRIDDTYIFRKTLLNLYYARFDQIKRVFLRKRESNCSTCTQFIVTDCYLVFEGINGKEYTYLCEKEDIIRKILEVLKDTGKVNVGYHKL